MITPTEAQSRIRDAPGLSLLIVAPAGCGKTEAMALRVAGLLERGQVPWPSKALVTTFSNRARDNIRERLQRHVPAAAIRDRVTVANFHGLAARVFRAHANVIGLDPQMIIPDSDWVGDQCRSRKLSFQRAHDAQDTLRTIKQQPLDDAAVRAALAGTGDRDAIEIEQQRVAEHRLTYDDLPRVAELILQDKSVADLYSCLFACVLVDEFQDLTPQLLRMIRHIGRGKTTYAGDIAQAIYGFAGAAPTQILQEIQEETGGNVIVFADSHRSSPAVLDMVNALAPFTGGQRLRSADPASWPGGGLSGLAVFRSTAAEAEYARCFAATVLQHAPGHRIGVIARTAPRRRFADAAFEQSALPWHRWDDPVLDTDTAKIMKATLGGISRAAVGAEPDLLAFLRRACGLESVHDPGTRQVLNDAVGWACDLLREGLSPAQVRARIRMGDDSTLLTAPGVHLLTGHTGKGQQFDWVVIVGAEEGCIPDFRASAPNELVEEARILSVMISRARHGVLLLRAGAVESLAGKPWPKQPSRFLAAFDGSKQCRDREGIRQWICDADWTRLSMASS
jgi:DNA helicase-2/ATP-dependent DNA helicase PcrA